MPNFARLAAQGSFRRLTTSIPPQSPVAWSNMITGMNAGGHGVFDFIHRDPKTLQLYFSTSKVEGPKHSFHIGSWVIPLGSGSAEELRHGKAFWEILDEHGVPNYVYRIPANFPPIAAKGKTLSGMGTPDLRGTYGTFTFYTDDPTAAVGALEGGEIVQVEVKNNRVTTNLIGPDNTFRRNSPPSTEPFTVDVDPLESVARIGLAGPTVCSEGRRMERMGSGGISTHAGLRKLDRQCEGHLPFLSQADASAFSALRFADQYRSGKSRSAHLHALELLARFGETDWRIPHARHCRRHEGAYRRRARRQRISGTVAHRARRTSARVRCGVSKISRGPVLLLFFEPRSERAHVVAADRSAESRVRRGDRCSVRDVAGRVLRADRSGARRGDAEGRSTIRRCSCFRTTGLLPTGAPSI